MRRGPGALWLTLMLLVGSPPAQAMHISDGVLPLSHALLWFLVAAPFYFLGLRDMQKAMVEVPRFKVLLGLIAAAVCVISSTEIPVPTAGTCSHACGTGLAALVLGPGPTVVLASVALVIQALFLGDGGITTLGADLVSMGVVGAYVGYGLFVVLKRLRVPEIGTAFLVGVLSDWAIYAMSALELALGTHGTATIGSTFWTVMAGYMPTQVPLGVLEGILCVGVWRFVKARRPELLPR